MAGSLSTLLTDFRRRYKVPGAAAGLLTKEGSLSAAFVGTTTRGGSTPISETELWHIGSCAKSMTAALYARLVERGDASWKAPLAGLLGEHNSASGWNTISVDDVLRHKGGVRPNMSVASMNAALRSAVPVVDQRRELAHATLQKPPRNPGQTRYSNLGYTLVGTAIERICGTTFEEALGTHVLEPLGIRSSGFGAPPRPSGHRGRLALGGTHVGRGRPVPPSNPRSDNPPIMSPAGRLHLDIHDWAKFHLVFLNRGGDFLNPSSIEHLTSVPPGHGANQGMGWAPGPPKSNIALGQQGSNTMWIATALINRDYTKTALVVCNDGRTRLIPGSGRLAMSLLEI
ncbi:MAG: beta-lactamase family protein [Acidimicrobiia bacterium]|nr:beta-lactamase family protein [Acidimicrobiia bacterium]